MFMLILRTVGSLIFVLLLFWLALKGVKRLKPFDTTHHLKKIDQLALTPKQSVVLVQVGDSVLCLGSAETGITLLQTFDVATLETSPALLAPKADLREVTWRTLFEKIQGQSRDA